MSKSTPTPTATGEKMEFGAPHPDAVEIEGVVVLGYDPAADKWLGIRWRDTSTLWLVGGGRENQETFRQSAIRGLHEEAGFQTYSEVIQIGNGFIAHYYNERKKSYRRGIGECYLFFLDPKAATAQNLEAHENFDPVWMPFDELYTEIEKTGGGVEHWLAILKLAKSLVYKTV